MVTEGKSVPQTRPISAPSGPVIGSAGPEEHMQRVTEQGDLRPMSGNREAMDDLRRILAGRSAFYGRADLAVDTTGKPPAESFAQLREAVRSATGH